MATRSPIAPFAGRLRPGLLDELTVEQKAIALPTVIGLVMLLIGSVTGKLAGIDGTALVIPYFLASFSITLLSLLVFIFVQFARLAVRLAPNPIPTVWSLVRVKAPYLFMPLVVFPIFLTGFSTAKSSIPALVGYHWDAFWANADVLIFGNDAWKITRAFVPESLANIWQWFYSTAWVLALALFGPNVVIYANPRRIGVMFTAMLATCVVAGCLLAYCFSAGGPAFVHLFDVSLAERFRPLREIIENPSWGAASVRRTQESLSISMYASFAVKGGGISAMPSMHLGMTSIYVLAARRTKWFLPALAFWILIFIGSAYFGYHYWIDGLVAAAVAWICWQAAEALFRPERSDRAGSGASGPLAVELN